MERSIKTLVLCAMVLCANRSMAQGDEVTYRVKIDASELLLAKNGKDVLGSARVRITITGPNGEAIIGKQVEGSFGTIIFRDYSVGRPTSVELQVEGVYWDRRIDIKEVVIHEMNDNDESKRYVFPAGCTLTQGNSRVLIDRGGPVDFTADKAALAAEDETHGRLNIKGEFANGEVNGDNFTISSEARRKNEKELRVLRETADAKRICTTKQIEASASFDINFLTNPSMQSIYPGALISSESIAEGSYVNIPASRRPIVVSTDIAVIGSPVIPIQEPKLSSFREAMVQLLVAQEKGDIEVQVNFEIKEVYNKEQLSIALGGHFAYAGSELNFDFAYNSESEKTLKVVKFAQIYYTMDMDQPDSPFDLFQREDDALRILHSGETPLVVSSVTYGRMAYFFMKTEASSSEIKAHMDAAYSGSVDVRGSGDFGLSKLLQTNETSALIIGGSGKNGITPVDGYDGFIDMLRDGGELSATSVGKPISYTLRYLADWKVARVNLTTSYVKRECREVAVTEEEVSVSLDKVAMPRMYEADSEIGYSFSMILLDGNNNAVATILSRRRTEENQLTFDSNRKEVQEQTFGNFKYKVADVDKYKVRIAAQFTEYDPWPVADDQSSHEQTIIPLKELLPANAAFPTQRKFTVINGEDELEWYYTVKPVSN